MSKYKVVVGLGNPGQQYELTRHNIGYRVIDELARRLRPIACASKLKADISEVHGDFGKVFLFKSQTYMNESGEPLGEFCRYYKISPEEILAIYDELDLPFGHLRLTLGGSAGGHNGVRSLIEHLGAGFARLRLGIGDNRLAGLPSEQYVLGTFKPEEFEGVSKTIDKATELTLQLLQPGQEHPLQMEIAAYNKSLA